MPLPENVSGIVASNAIAPGVACDEFGRVLMFARMLLEKRSSEAEALVTVTL